MAAIVATITEKLTTAADNQKFLEALQIAKNAFSERGIVVDVTLA